MLNSTGKVNYNDALLTLCLLLLLACGPAAGEAWAIRKRGSGSSPGRRYGWPIRTAMIVIALAYFFAGFQKWRYSGLPWVTSDNLRWILYAASDNRRIRTASRCSSPTDPAGACVRRRFAAARDDLPARAVRPAASLAVHSRRRRDARRDPTRDRARLLGAVAYGTDRVRELAACVVAWRTGTQGSVVRQRADGDAESIVLYDEDCGFCKWSLNKILAWDRSRRLRPVPIQSEEGERLLADVAPETRLDSWHLVDADGRLDSAGAAVPPLARLLPWGGPLAAVFAAFPAATDRGYRYVARHRDRWARILRIDAACAVRRR